MTEQTHEMGEFIRPFEYKKDITLDVEDIAKFKSITSTILGEKRTSYKDWNDKAYRADHLRDLNKPSVRANQMITDEILERYGPDHYLTKAAYIVSSITPEVNQIAAKQLEGYNGSKSWFDVEPDVAKTLFSKIDNILMDPEYSIFFTKNQSFKDALSYIKNTLLQTGDPDKIYSEYSKYIQSCIKDNSEGKVVLYVPLNSDYTHPTASSNEKTMVCEADISLLAPLPPEKKDYFNRINQFALEYLPHRKFAKNNKKLNFVVGDTVMGAGMQVFSTTSGETFTFKNAEENEHGFYLALNALDKKKGFWMVNGKLSTSSWPELNEDMTPYFETLYLSHEKAHRFWPYYGVYGEFPADVPSVLFSLRYCQKLGLNQKQMVRAIATEYFGEVLEYMDGEKLKYPSSKDKDTQLSIGYLVSAVEICNAIAESHLITVSSGRININNDHDTLDLFEKKLEQINGLFHKGDPNFKERFKLPKISYLAKPILELYQRASG